MVHRIPNGLATLVTLAILLTACDGSLMAAKSTDVETLNGSTNTLPLAPTKPSEPGTVTGLAYDQVDGSLLKTDAAGLFRLTTDGTAWEAIQTPATSGLTGLALDPDDAATLYVSGPVVGVLKSTDGGRRWSVINDGLVSTDVVALAMHSFRHNSLYVWLNDTGVFSTEDGGKSWIQMPDPGPPDKDVRALTFSTLPGSMKTGWLYASTPTGAYLSMDCF